MARVSHAAVGEGGGNDLRGDSRCEDESQGHLLKTDKSQSVVGIVALLKPRCRAAVRRDVVGCVAVTGVVVRRFELMPAVKRQRRLPRCGSRV